MIDIQKILKEIKKLPTFENEIMLQTPNNIKDPFYGTGSKWVGRRIYNQYLFPTFEELYYTNEVIKNLNLFGTRLMRVYSKTCYTYHKDRTAKIHIPLITNENNFFVLEDNIIRMPANGNHYFIDTTKKHTFVNASKDDRLHIVGCVHKPVEN